MEDRTEDRAFELLKKLVKNVQLSSKKNIDSNYRDCYIGFHYVYKTTNSKHTHGCWIGEEKFYEHCILVRNFAYMCRF